MAAKAPATAKTPKVSAPAGLRKIATSKDKVQEEGAKKRCTPPTGFSRLAVQQVMMPEARKIIWRNIIVSSQAMATRDAWMLSRISNLVPFLGMHECFTYFEFISFCFLYF